MVKIYYSKVVRVHVRSKGKKTQEKSIHVPVRGTPEHAPNAGVQYKPHFLYKRLSMVNHSYHLENGGKASSYMLPVRGQLSKWAFVGIAALGLLLLRLFCILLKTIFHLITST